MTLIYHKAFKQHATLFKRNQVYWNDELGQPSHNIVNGICLFSLCDPNHEIDHWFTIYDKIWEVRISTINHHPT